MSIDHGVIYATVRSGDDDDTNYVECRFADGQKYAAVETNGHKSDELAFLIAEFLNQRNNQ